MNGKASFDDVYDQPDPRAYYRSLSGLEYQIPGHAQGLFGYLARTLRERSPNGRLVAADLCCSYGVNAALLNHDVTLAQLYERYGSAELQGLPADDVIAADRGFFADRRYAETVSFLGVDVAANAVAYATQVGLLDQGFAENLEEHAPSDALARGFADAALVTVTGGIGYITEATFDRLLRAREGQLPPWLAMFTLRWVDMDAIVGVLERHGLTTERLERRTFRQRRFADDRERDYVLGRLRELGLAPDGVETDGYHHTWLYLARPHADVGAVPLDQLLQPAL